MAVLSRFARLVSADLHAVIDRLEDPDALLRQALRDLREQVEQTRSLCAAGAREQQRLRDRQQRITARLQQLSVEVDSALQAERDELARHLLRERIGLERERDDGVARLQTLDRAQTADTQRLADQRERMTHLEARVDRLAPEETPTAQPTNDIGPTARVSDADVEVALIRAKQAGRSA